MKKFFIKNKKIIIFLSLVFVLFFLFFLLPEFVLASEETSTQTKEGGTIARIIGWLLTPIIRLFGWLASTFMVLLVSVAEYSNFIHSTAVTLGWAMVRDISNMFFIIILLIISFATILRVEQYNIKTLLPKLILMAILINFSKMICGIFIDVAQIIMLAFVSSFSDIAGANLSSMLGLTEIYKMKPQSGTAGGDAGLLMMTIILALAFSVIAAITVLTMLIMLAMRIVMIWIYVVLSPLAYLLAAFPQGQTYSQRWWSEFSKNLIIGPVLAFFIWLSFASLGGPGGGSEAGEIASGAGAESIQEFNQDSGTGGQGLEDIDGSAPVSEAASETTIMRLILSIGMLMGGMMIAQEMGGQAGKVVSKGMSKMQSMGSSIAKGASKGGRKALTGIGKGAGEAALRTTGAIGKGLTGGKGNKLTRLAGGWGQDMKESRQKSAAKTRQNIMENIGMGKRAGAAGAELTGAIKSRLNVGDRKGQEKINEGTKLKTEGNIKLELAGNIERTRAEWSELSSDASRMTDGSPEKIRIEKEIDLKARQLEDYKVGAGLSATADDATTNAKLVELKRDGSSYVDSGSSLIEEGEKKQSASWSRPKFGNLLIGSTHKAFQNLNSDHVEAEDFVKNLSSEPPAMGRISSGSFSGVGGNLNTKQKATFEGLAKNNQASKNLEKTFTNTLFNPNGTVRKNVKKEDLDRASEFAQGAKTFKTASGGNLPKNIKDITDVYDRYVSAASPKGLKKTDDYNAGKYRISGTEKESKGMDVNQSGIGSINEFGRGNRADQLETAQTKYTQLETQLQGMDANDPNRGNVQREFDENADNLRQLKISSGLDQNADAMVVASQVETMRNDRSDTISYNFDKLKAQGIDIDTKAEGVYLEGEVKEKVKVQIIADIDKELDDLKSKASSGVELSAKDNRRMNILEGSKSRLEKKDNFSLVNANKKMGLSEAVVTQRHEGAHQELDNKRKQDNFVPTKKHQEQEERLVEYYGGTARENKVTDKKVDEKVAKVIFEGQKSGKSDSEIKVKIEEAVRGEKVSNIIQKESAPVQNITNITNINQGASSSEAPINVNVNMNKVEGQMDRISDSIKDTRGDIRGVRGEVKQGNVSRGIFERLMRPKIIKGAQNKK